MADASGHIDKAVYFSRVRAGWTLACWRAHLQRTTTWRQQCFENGGFCLFPVFATHLSKIVCLLCGCPVGSFSNINHFRQKYTVWSYARFTECESVFSRDQTLPVRYCNKTAKRSKDINNHCRESLYAARASRAKVCAKMVLATSAVQYLWARRGREARRRIAACRQRYQ